MMPKTVIHIQQLKSNHINEARTTGIVLSHCCTGDFSTVTQQQVLTNLEVIFP